MGLKNLFLLVLTGMTAVGCACRYYTNPILERGADPWVIERGGRYYYCGGGKGGICVSVSDRPQAIGEGQLVWRPGKGRWNSTCVWAPELHWWQGKWYIFYAAGWSGPPYVHQRTGVLESVTDDPTGDYVDKGMVYTGDTLGKWDSNRWAIDMTLMEHRGKLYGIWSGWESSEATDKTPQNLYIAEMSNPWTTVTPRVLISEPDTPYELAGGELPINEGPQVLKHGDDTFIVYSCGQSWLDTYKLSWLRLRSPDADPLKRESWIKSDKPVFEDNEYTHGVGHASFTTSPDGRKHYIIYHTKKEKTPGWNREVRMQRFRFRADGTPDFGEPVDPAKRLKGVSGRK